MCKDIDECAQPRTCHPNAVCTNTPGKFFCSCKSGYSGCKMQESNNCKAIVQETESKSAPCLSCFQMRIITFCRKPEQLDWTGNSNIL